MTDDLRKSRIGDEITVTGTVRTIEDLFPPGHIRVTVDVDTNAMLAPAPASEPLGLGPTAEVSLSPKAAQSPASETARGGCICATIDPGYGEGYERRQEPNCPVHPITLGQVTELMTRLAGDHGHTYTPAPTPPTTVQADAPIDFPGLIEFERPGCGSSGNWPIPDVADLPPAVQADDEPMDHCDCADFCEMGPTCPGGWHLPGAGCARVQAARDAGQVRLTDGERLEIDQTSAEHDYPTETDDGIVMRCRCGATPPSHYLGQQVEEALWLWEHRRREQHAAVERILGARLLVGERCGHPNACPHERHGYVPGSAFPIEDAKSDVDRVARVLMAAWEEAEKARVGVTYVASFVDMARAVLAARQSDPDATERESLAKAWERGAYDGAQFQKRLHEWASPMFVGPHPEPVPNPYRIAP